MILKHPEFLILLIPIILLLSFLSKQTPAVYGIISITILVLFLYYIEKKLFKVN